MSHERRVMKVQAGARPQGPLYASCPQAWPALLSPRKDWAPVAAKWSWEHLFRGARLVLRRWYIGEQGCTPD
jgi:hypothetical protein